MSKLKCDQSVGIRLQIWSVNADRFVKSSCTFVIWHDGLPSCKTERHELWRDDLNSINDRLCCGQGPGHYTNSIPRLSQSKIPRHEAHDTQVSEHRRKAFSSCGDNARRELLGVYVSRANICLEARKCRFPISSSEESRQTAWMGPLE